MDESEKEELRRTRLKEWLGRHGGVRHVCVKRGLKKSRESYISQVLGGARFGQLAARNLERDLGMDKGYLEGDDPGAPINLPSALAMELAWLFDDVIREMGPRDRARVYQATQEAMTRELSPLDVQPSDKPVRPALRKTRPV